MSAFSSGPAHLPASLQTISSDDLAAILGVSTDTLYNRATRTPNLLPPSLKIGGKRLYRVVDVEAWLLKQLQVPQASQASGAPSPSSSTSLATTTTKRRGRPPKAAQLAKRQGVGNE